MDATRQHPHRVRALLAGLAVTAMSATLISCGTASSSQAHDRDADARSTAPIPGCSSTVDPIVESKEFVSFGSQMTTNPFVGRLSLQPLSNLTLPGWIPPELDGVDALGATASGGSITVAYGTEKQTGKYRSDLLAAGAILLDVAPIARNQNIAEELASDSDTAGRVTVVPVAKFDAAVTWADPNEQGIREHHVLWSDPGGLQYDVSGVRAPEALVGIARELAC